MNKKNSKKRSGFPLEKYPKFSRNTFILSILISLFLKLFSINDFGNLDIFLPAIRVGAVGASAVGLIASLKQKKTLYAYLNGLMMALFYIDII